MTFGANENLFLALVFIVPGFIWYTVMSAFVPRRVETKELSLLRFLTLSCINFAIWAWLIYLVLTSNVFLMSLGWSATAWAIVTFVSPVILGVIFGKGSQSGVFRNFLQRLGFYTIHPIPTGWDYFFSQEEPVWVLVTLIDESQVGGFFGPKSFASDEPGERDIYIQEVFKVSQDGPWEGVDKSKGILIKGDHVKHIEFWRD